MVTESDDKLQKYSIILQNLRSSKKGYKKTYHKHLMMLSIIKILERDPAHPNRFTFEELEPVFGNLWEAYRIGNKSDAFLEYPFYHMSSEGFWHFKIKDNSEALFKLYKYSRQPTYRFTKSRIQETIEYAFLDDDLYELLLDDNSRETIRTVMEGALFNGETGVLEVNESASLFQHEFAAIDFIAKNVQKYSLGKIISNLLLFDHGTNQYYECDIIVISYCGIYLVELKHWSGHIKISPYNWVKDHVKYRPDPHTSNSFKAKILKGIYQHHFRTYPTNLYVESVVVLTNPEAEVVGASNPKTDKHCPTFESLDSFVDYLRHQNKTKPKILSLAEIDRVTEHLKSLGQPRQASRYSIPGYEIVEHLTQKPDLIEVVARPQTGRFRKLFRFRVFPPPTKADPQEKKQVLKRAQNTLDAVTQIGDHPHILRVWPVPDETGAIIEGSEWSEQGTLRDWILSEEDPFNEKEALRICTGILKALEAAHGKGVIHRAVKPENVLMLGGEPKLMNFDLSFQLSSDLNVTVIPDTSALKRDAYTAPEVYARQDVDECTDLFAVGVILCELLTGGRPFKVSTDLQQSGGRLPPESLSKLSAKGISEEVIETIDQLVRFERTERIGSAAKVLSLLGVGRETTEQLSRKHALNQKLEPEASYDIYRIERLIGEGTEAQVYKARRVRKQTVALKLFNRDIPSDRILNEQEAAGSVKSSYIVHAKRIGHWNNDRYFIEMDYFEGRLMREDISACVQPDKDAFTGVTVCLLEAVRALHQRQVNETIAPIVHGDIKPDNIILRQDGSAVLFDFGCAGPPRIDSYQGTEGYVAPDLVSGADLQFCESGDLFALGVSLFEWLFGKRPYATPRLGDRPPKPEDPPENFPKSLVNWVLKAVQTDSADRYADIDEMRQAFLKSIEEAEARVEPLTSTVEAETAIEGEAGRLLAPLPDEKPGNPFVAYLNSLHNASSGNENALAESQALSSFFGHIHFPLKVTDYIYKQLTCENGPHIILTGHAGDGKSTIGLELYKRWKGLAHEEPLPEKMRNIEELSADGREILLIKDMSELTEENRLHLLKEASGPCRNGYFIISNTGTLLNTFKALCATTQEWSSLQDRLLAALEAGIPKDFSFRGGRFQLINLARTDNISTACEIFERMLNPKLWELCERVSCPEECPVYKNVTMLRENWDIVKKRVELTYRRLFEYGSRLTLRQMTGHLAYSITAGLDYRDIAELSGKAKRPPLRHLMFFNRFFGDCGEIPDPAAEQIKALREVRVLEPGRQTHQRLERRLWTHRGSGELPSVQGVAQPFYDSLRSAASSNKLVEGLTGGSARLQVRRLVFLFGRFDSEEAENRFISTFLHSPMVVDFARWQKEGGSVPPLERKRLTQSILHVLQEHFTGVRLPENAGDQENIYITLNRRNYEIRQSAQIVLARFPADNFRFGLRPFDSGIGDIRYKPRLGEVTTEKELPLELPFLDYVTNRFRGEIAQRLQSFYTDRLERFKVELLGAKKDDQSNDMMLIRLQLNYSFKSQTISVRENIMEIF